ncbi:MAG: hypothetical protein IV090_23540 [Candidatus Sericytochromatia bacterium]|nr:hypothetical protein [Candidatus Sericytochromatia bacterium]
MQGWDTRSIIRTGINGLVLVLLLSACNLQPPSLKTTTTEKPNAAAPKSNVSWIPQDVYYQKKAGPRSENFKIQDYPQDCGGNICSVTALSANMKKNLRLILIVGLKTRKSLYFLLTAFKIYLQI